MMEVKVAEALGVVLDWMVIVALYGMHDYSRPQHAKHFKALREQHPLHAEALYSTNWAQGGPIIGRERINIAEDIHPTMNWTATLYVPDEEAWQFDGPTPLIAAMRCFVASTLGEEVDVPEELYHD
jgi:hypothetical protein